MSIAQYARAYAAAIERWETAKLYLDNIDMAQVKAEVTWDWGRGLGGQSDLAKVISKTVTAQMPVFLNAALAELEREVRAAERQLLTVQVEARDKVGAT